MEFSWLEDFVALADCGNFSRAAERRHLTQPAFSRRIRLLEDWAGAQLFDRTAQPITLTLAGQSLRPALEDILRRLLQAREEVRQMATSGETTLRFAATHSLSLTFFPAWIQSLGSRLQLGPIHLVSESMLACEQVMLEGDAQFMLCHGHDAVPPRLEERHFLSRQIGGDTLMPVSAPDAQGGARFQLSQDKPCPFLAYSSKSGFSKIIATVAGTAAGAAALQTVFTSHSAAVLRMMACDGRGLAWLPLSLIADDLAQRSLVAAAPADRHIALAIWLFRPRARQSLTAETFWAALS